MDASAIKAIQQLAINAEQRNRLGDLDDISPVAILAGSKGGQVLESLERFMPSPSRYRGVYITNVLSEFVAYTNRHPGAACFVDDEAMNAVAYFDLGTPDAPGHGDHRAILELHATAAYEAAQDASRQDFTQKALVNFIEDWSYCLRASKSDAPDAPTSSIKEFLPGIRSINIKASLDATHADRDFGASKSRLEDIEANAKGTLPAVIYMSVTPYLGFEKRELRFRLQVRTDPDEPTLQLRLVGAEKLREDLATEFKASLLEEIGSRADEIAIGTFRH